MLFGVVFFIMLLIAAIIQPFFPPVHFTHHSTLHNHAARPINLHLWVLGLFQTLLVSIASAPCMVAVHRFVLLKEKRQEFWDTRRVVFFTGWIAAFHLLPALPGPFLGRIDLVAFVFIFVTYYCMGRFVMSFPAIALDIANPLRDSWTRTRGHWWEIVSVMIVGLLPFLIPVILIAAGASETLRIFLISVMNTIFPAVGAGLASELYRKFGGLQLVSAQVPNQPGTE